jgi:hypothetical protein
MAPTLLTRLATRFNLRSMTTPTKKTHGGPRTGSGRRPEGEAIRNAPKINVRLHPELLERVMALARAEDKSFNQLVTELLEARLVKGKTLAGATTELLKRRSLTKERR